MSVKYKILHNRTHHKHEPYLLSCALRCPSKLQEIQSLENFISMAIQGIQVSIYTNTYCFYIFCIYLFIYEKQNKQNLKNNQTKT